MKKTSIILSYFDTIFKILINLIYVPILLKNIGQDEYGLYQLVASVIVYFNMMESFLSAGVLRYYCKYNNLKDEMRKENILAISRRIYILISFGLLIISIPAIKIFEEVYKSSFTLQQLEEAKLMLLLLIINICISFTNYVYVVGISANEEFVFLRSISILTNVLQPICVLLFISHHRYAITVVLIQIILNIIMCLARMYFCKSKLKLKIKYHYLDKEYIKELLVFSGAILINSFADQVFWKSGQLMSGKIIGLGAVAIYSIGSQIYQSYMYVGTSISSIYLPRISALYDVQKSMNKITSLFTRVSRLSLFVEAPILIAFALYGKEFMILWAGEGYEIAYYIALIVMIPFTIDIIQNVGLYILQISDNYSFRAKMNLVIALINIPLSFILLKKFNLIGAAFSTSFSILIGNVLIINVYYSRKIGLDMKSYWKKIARMIPCLLISLACGYLISFIKFNNLALTFLVHCGLFVLCYGVTIIFLGLEEQEKKVLFELMRKFLPISH